MTGRPIGQAHPFFGPDQKIGGCSHGSTDQDRLPEGLEIRRNAGMSGAEGTGGAFAMDKEAPALASDPVLLHLAGVM
jgi:hypothetical protein